MKSYTKLLVIVVALAVAPWTFAQTDLSAISEEMQLADKYYAAGDHSKAFKSYRRMAKEGNYRAQYQVAKMYAEGEGTKQDMIDAYAWSAVAAESGTKDMQGYSDELLAGIDKKDSAEKEANKLISKYGNVAQAARLERLAMRNARSECTGSRLGCSSGSNTQIYDKPIAGEGTAAPGAIASDGGD